MANFKSEKTLINASAENVYEKLSNLENLKELLDKIPQEAIPEDKKSLFNNVTITADSITIPGGPAGEIKLRMADKMPYSLIGLTGEGTPVAMSMQMEIQPVNTDSCDVTVSLDIAIPAMLKPMVAGPLKKVVDQFAAVLKAIPFN